MRWRCAKCLRVCITDGFGLNLPKYWFNVISEFWSVGANFTCDIYLDKQHFWSYTCRPMTCQVNIFSNSRVVESSIWKYGGLLLIFLCAPIIESTIWASWRVNVLVTTVCLTIVKCFENRCRLLCRLYYLVFDFYLKIDWWIYVFCWKYVAYRLRVSVAIGLVNIGGLLIDHRVEDATFLSCCGDSIKTEITLFWMSFYEVWYLLMICGVVSNDF